MSAKDWIFREAEYDLLAADYYEWLPYAVHSSDSLAMMTQLNEGSNVIADYKFVEPLQPYLLDCKIGLTEWPGTVMLDSEPYTRPYKEVMMVYKACVQVTDILLDLSNLMVRDFELFKKRKFSQPDDLQFYRGEVPWLYSITHEKEARLVNPTKEDIEYFKKYDLY